MSLSSNPRLLSFSVPAANFCGSTSSFDEEKWIIQIRRALDEEEELEDETTVCIFNVPKPLMATDSNSYTPQEVAIGPYHHWRQDLYEMQRYKIAAAKRAKKQLHSLKFDNLVEQLKKYEMKIRSCYHKYLDFNSETFAYMMAIDASFLLEVLRVYTVREENSVSIVSSKLSYLVDYEGRKSMYDAILRDIVMLENQIPLFVLRKMLELQFSASEPADEMLLSMLLGLFKDLSPFKGMEDSLKIQVSVSKCFHLLDFIYQMITPKLADPFEVMEDHDQNQNEPAKENSGISSSKLSSGTLSKLGIEIWKLLAKLYSGLIRLLKRITMPKPLQVIFKLAWTIISKLPGKEKDNHEIGTSGSDGNPNRLPLLEEITIPSVSQLSNSGVGFLPAGGGIATMAFDAKAVILYLPTINLDVNSEVVLRNLVAYEASKASGPLVLTRFIELMNGIIDSVEDVKLLKGKGIVLNHLKSDVEVAELWNGMSKSIKLTKVPLLDTIIQDVNNYYNSRMKVKTVKFIEKYVYGSWSLLVLLATILLLLMTALEAVCSVYSCSQVFDHHNATGTSLK